MLPAFVGSAKTTVVIVSDALRYEVARDVAALLERERGGNVKVSSMQAVFPSITEVGMPALLPHQVLELAEDGAFVLADGMPTATTPQREAVLTHVEPTARAFALERIPQHGGNRAQSAAQRLQARLSLPQQDRCHGREGSYAG